MMKTYSFTRHRSGEEESEIIELSEDQLEQKHIDLLAGDWLHQYFNLPKASQEIIKKNIT